MKKMKTTHWVLGAINLALASSPIAASADTTQPTFTQKQELLNTASLKTIESSWLQVPAACKAKGFNADPKRLTQNTLSTMAQKAYLAYGA